MKWNCDMSASSRRLRSSGKASRAATPLSVERLEARMLCAVDDLADSLNLLAATGSGFAARTSVKPPVNAAPTFAAPVMVLSGNSASGKEIRLVALGKDDKGESNLKYTWKVTEAPSGGTATFTANNSNSAKITSLVFSKPGVYGVKVTVTDKGGLMATATQRITIKASTGSLSVLTSSNKAVLADSTITVTGKTEQFKVQALDQFGKALNKQPQFTWSVVSAPSGGTASLSTSAGAASVLFNKAGTYKFKVTSATGSVLSFSVSVVQTATRVGVTPGSSALASGTTKQFTAQVFDQFDAAMINAPVTWSTSAGTISNGGLFTAPSVASTVTITAKSGTAVGTATASVAVQSVIKTAALSSLVTTLYADGSLSRIDVMNILRSTGTDGVVDGTELSDLRYVVANAPRYKMDSYVQVLASNVVNTNAANLLYQGVAAGNLAAGSAASLLTILVDKWFLGTDVPVLTSSSLSYRSAAGALFSGTPSRYDERQGMLGDCYFIATLGAIADRNPTAVSNMFIDNGDGTFTVRFYTGQYGAFYRNDGTISDGFLSGQGTADYVTVNRMLPAFSNGTFAYSNYGKQLSSTTAPLWIALAEKAYAQWNATGKAGRNGTNSYASIEGGWMAPVNAQVLGINSTDYYMANASKQSLINALTANQSVTIGTRWNASAGGLVGSHAYSVTGYDSVSDTFSLYNPWGSSQPTPLTWAALQTNCSMFVVVNASASTAIARYTSTNTVSLMSSLASESANAPLIEIGSLSETVSTFILSTSWSPSMFDDLESSSAEFAEQSNSFTLGSQQSGADLWSSNDWETLSSDSSSDDAAVRLSHLSPELVDQVIDDIDALLSEALA